MAASTLARSRSSTVGLPLSTFDTVATETPADKSAGATADFPSEEEIAQQRRMVAELKKKHVVEKADLEKRQKQDEDKIKKGTLKKKD